MKKCILAAALSSAMILAVPAAFANSTTYTFDFTAGSGSNDNLSSYTATYGTGSATNVTATAVGVYYSVGSATAYTGGALQSGYLGQYGGAGLGACEATVGIDCTSPNHQIDNGTNGGTTDDYEFILIKFSSAVDLASIQLGNFGGGSGDPFSLTYYTSASTAASLALAGTTIGNSTFTGTDGFSGAQSDSAHTGTCTVDTGTPTTCTDTTATNDVTYLLIGASISASGADYFKIQDINANTYNSSSPTPEPATFGLIGLALAGLGAYSRKRQSSRS
jgi:PEP-CTERM motif